MSGEPSRTNGDAPRRRPLVGRADELDRLTSTVSAGPAVAVIEGEAGIGKTRLLSELRTRPELTTHRLLFGACRHIREPYPLGPIVDALRQLDDDLGPGELSAVSGALHPLLPELAHLLPPRPEPLPGRSAERHRTFRGLRDLLEALGPTVLAVEDVHWIDQQTLDFLSYLLATPPPSLTVILTFRSEEASPRVRALTARLPESADRLHLTLRPFGPSQTGAMVATLLDIEQVSEEFATYLCQRASGLPFAIQGLVALLQARGTLVRRETGWARKAVTELNVPDKIRDQVLERVGRLTEAGRAVAEAAATLQLPANLATLVGASLVRDHDALRGVDEALESGLLVEQTETLGFRHLLAAQAVYADIPLPLRQDLHRRAADSLEQLWPVPVGQVAHHRRGARQAMAWISAAEKAADVAAETGDETEAARLLDELLRTAPLDTEQRARLAVKLGRVALEATRPADLIAPLSDALEREADLPTPVRGKLHFWLGPLMHRTGHDPPRQRRLFARAVDELDDQPELKASAMICLVLGSPPKVSEHLTWVRRACEVLPEVDDPTYEVFLQSKVGGVLVMVGDPAWRQAADRITEQTRGEPRHRHEVRAYSTIASCAGWAGHHDMADDWLTRALSAPACQADERLMMRLQANAAVLDFCRGRWSGLRERVDRLGEHFAERPRIRIDLDVAASRLALAEGDLNAAESRLDDLTRAVVKLDAFDLLPLAIETQIRLALAAGDVPTAIAATDQLRDAVRSIGIWLPTIRAIPAVVEAMVAAGRTEEAGRWLTRLGQDMRELDAPLAPAAFEHAHGLLAASEGRWDSAVGHFQTSASRFEALGARYETALAREQAARAQLVASPPAAEQPLRAAAATYRDLGARWDLDRIAAMARTHGVSLPARHRGGRRGYGTELSPREREVADLAAAGHTNREIAEKLFVSVNTVKKQLSSAMRKLGVHSRSALPRRLESQHGVVEE